MRNRIMTISDPVRQKVTILGAEGERWLVGLDDLIGELEQEWQVIVESSLAGGSEAYYLSHLTGMDTQAIWQWGFIQCMSTGLLLMQVGQEQSGIQMLKVAEAWTRA